MQDLLHQDRKRSARSFSSLGNDQLFGSPRDTDDRKHQRRHDEWVPDVPSVEPEWSHESAEPIGLKENAFSVDTWEGDDGDPRFAPPTFSSVPDPRLAGNSKVLRQDGLVGVSGTDDLAYGPDWVGLEEEYREQLESDPTYQFYDLVAGHTGVEIEEVAHLDDLETRLSRLQQQREYLRRQTQWETQALRTQTRQFGELSKKLTEKREQLTTFGFRGSAARVAQHQQNTLRSWITAHSAMQQNSQLIDWMLFLLDVTRKTLTEFSPLTPDSPEERGAKAARQAALSILDLLTAGPAVTTVSGGIPMTFTKTVPVTGEDYETVRDEETIERVSQAKGFERTKEFGPTKTEVPAFMDVWPIVALAQLSALSILLKEVAEEFPEEALDFQSQIEILLTKILDSYKDRDAVRRRRTIQTLSNAVSKLPWENIRTLWLGAYRERLDTIASKTLRDLRVATGSARANLADIIARMPRAKEGRAVPGLQVPKLAPDANFTTLVKHAEQLIEVFQIVIEHQVSDPKAGVEADIRRMELQLASLEQSIQQGPKPPGPEDAKSLPYRHRSEWGTSPLITGKLRIRAEYRSATKAAHANLVDVVAEFRHIDYERFQFDPVIQNDFALLVAHQVALTRARNPVAYKRDREGRIHLDKISAVRKLRDSYIWNAVDKAFVRA